jgi:hypothetical protein
MNWKSTFILILTLGGVIALISYRGLIAETIGLIPHQYPKGEAKSLEVLRELNTKEWKSIQINRTGFSAIILKKKEPSNKRDAFQLEGDWAVRSEVVEELVDTIQNISTRFQPIPEAKLSDLDKEAKEKVEIIIETFDTTNPFKLLFYHPKEKAGEDPFTIPVFLRVNNEPEYIRLSPEIISIVSRSVESYRMRQIFDQKTRERIVEVVSLDAAPAATPIVSDQVQSIKVMTPSGGYTLRRIAPNPKPMPPYDRPTNEPVISTIRMAEVWRVSNGGSEFRVDPTVLQKVLQAVPELWVEKFILNTDTILSYGAMNGIFDDPFSFSVRVAVNLKLSELFHSGNHFQFSRGLDDNDKNKRIISLEYKNGITRTLHIGNISRVETKVENPPSLNPMLPPQPKITEIKYYYAKVGNSPLIFEINGEKLSDILLENSPSDDLPKSKDDPLGIAKKGSPFQQIRDKNPIRIDTDSVESVRIEMDIRTIELKKTKRNPRSESANSKSDRWDIIEPNRHLADTKSVQDLLNSLSQLKANSSEIIDQKQPIGGTGGPAHVDIMKLANKKDYTKVTLNYEANSGLSSRTIYLATIKNQLGRLVLIDQDQLLVSYLIESTSTEFLNKPDRAYRSRKLFDIPEENRIIGIEVKGANSYQLQELVGDKVTYRLKEPINLDADKAIASKIMNDLKSAEAIAFIYDPPTETEKRINEMYTKLVSSLMKLVNPICGFDFDYRTILGAYENPLSQYGLTQSATLVTIEFSGPNRVQPKNLLIGKENSEEKFYYAKFENSPSVFTIDQELGNALSKGALKLLPNLIWEGTSDDISSAKVKVANGISYSIEQLNNQWFLKQPKEIKLKSANILPTLGALATIKAERYESLNPDNLAKYGLDQPEIEYDFTTHVKLNDKDDTKKLLQRNIRIGKPVNGDKGRYAITNQSSAVIYLSEETVKSLNKSVFDLIDKELIRVELDKIKTIILTSKDSTTRIQKEGLKWIIEGFPVDLDKNTIDALLSAMTKFEVKSIVDFESEESLKTKNLDEKSFVNQILIETEDKFQYRLTIGGEVSTKKDSRYVYVSNSPIIGIIDSDLLRKINLTKLDLVNKDLLKFDANDIVSISRQMENESFQAAFNGSIWEGTEPNKFIGDNPTFDELTEMLSKLRANRVEAIEVKDLSPYGLDKPRIKLMIEYIQKGKPIKKILQIGNNVDNIPEKGAFTQLEGTNSVVVLNPQFIELVSAKRLHFQDKNLARLISVDKIQIQRGGMEYTLEKPKGKWVITSPQEAECEDEAVREIIDSLAKLRADTIIADKVNDLKTYGLDRPEKWKLFNGNKEVLSLLIGDFETAVKDGLKVPTKRRYAKLENKDMVVLLNPTLSNQLTAEVKKRNLWPSLDISQVNRIRVDIKGETGSFELTKSPLGWSDSKEPNQRISSDKVIQFLDKLASLKAERFISLKSDEAILKLYGLNPPERIITISTEKGVARVIHLGRLDNQKRFYARSVEPNSSEIVILEQSDSEILGLNRSDFQNTIDKK